MEEIPSGVPFFPKREQLIDNQPKPFFGTFDTTEIEAKDKENKFPVLSPSKQGINLFKKSDTINTIKKVIYNIKDFVFMSVLLISPLPNYSYLSLMYLIIGFIYLFLVLSQTNITKQTKFILEIIVICYSLLVLIFKFTISLNRNTFTNNTLLIDLGIPYLQDESFLFILSTFLSDSIVLIISIISFIISLLCRKTRKTKRKLTNDNVIYYCSLIIWFNFICACGISTFNMSFCSIVIIACSHLSLFMWVLFKGRIVIYVMKISNFVITITSIMLLMLNNVFNIPSLQTFKNDISLYKQLGLNIIKPQHISDLKLKECLIHFSFYAFSCGIMILSASSFRIVNLKDVVQGDKYSSFVNKKSSKKIKDNICIELFKKIGLYLQSSYFILHICRIGIILWLYLYRMYSSCGMLVWLFASFLVIKVERLMIITLLLLWPCLLYTCYVFHYVNIEGNFIVNENIRERIKIEHWSFKIWEHSQYWEYPFIQLIVCFCALFTQSLFRMQRKDDKVDLSNKPKVVDEHKISQIQELLKDNEKKKDKTVTLLQQQPNIDSDNNNTNIPLLDNNNNIINNDNQKDKVNDDKKTSLKFWDVILKFFLIHIDKVTLVCMYLISMNEVNITHLILVVVFMIQLIYPKAIECLCVYIIILIELLFVSEYVFDILKVFLIDYLQNNNLITIIEFIVTYDVDLNKTSVEILLLLGIYCFYIQRQNYNSKKYLELIKENNSNILATYINEKFISYPKFKTILFSIGTFLLELYVWILILLVFFFLCYFELSILFAIKFIMFLIICYQFISSFQKATSSTFHLCFYWIFLIYCCINTLLVYFYQFTMLPLIKDQYTTFISALLPDIIIKNFPVIGITEYSKERIWISFLPHFALNFISVLFYSETKRIIDSTKSNVAHKEQAVTTLRELDRNHKQLIDIALNPNDKKLKIQLVYDSNKRKINFTKWMTRVFQVGIFISKIYWMITFNIVCIMFTTTSLSIMMVIYLAIYGITFIYMYKSVIFNLVSFMKQHSFFISKLIRKSLIEEPFHIRQTKHYRQKGFTFLCIVSIIYLALIYLYALFDYVQNGCQAEHWSCNVSQSDLIHIVSADIEKYVKSVAYVIGIYVDIRKQSLVVSNGFHFILFLLICFDSYVQKFQFYLTDKVIEYDRLIKLLTKHNALYKRRYLFDNNILNKIGMNINQLGKNVLNEQQQPRSSERFSDIDKLESIKQQYKDNYLIEQFKYVFVKAGNKQEEIKISNSNSTVKFLQSTRKFFEELIISILIIIALSKVNVLSYVYMIIVIYFYISKKTMNKIYNLFIFLIVFIIIQCLLFVSNISIETDPNPDKDVLELIVSNLHMPWYKKLISPNQAFFFGLGVNKIQTRFLWLEFLEISLIYIYLDYFSYAIYQDEDKVKQITSNNDNNNEVLLVNNNEKKNITHKVYDLTRKKKLIQYVENMSSEEFENHRSNLLYTFDMDIGEYTSFKSIFHFHGKKHIEEIENENNQQQQQQQQEQGINHFQLKLQNNNKGNVVKKSKRVNKIKKSIKSAIYLYLHILVLSAIIIISMLISGIISAIYISFSLYFLMKSHKLILGTKCDYPRAIKTFMRIIIVIDILVQLIFQTPYVVRSNAILSFILSLFGVGQIINYDNPGSSLNEVITFNSNDFILVYAKAFVCLIMSIQVVVYSSEDFRNFYLSYILTNKDLTRKLAFVNVFWFNNKRVEQMRKEYEHRKNTKIAMENLERLLEKWDKKLASVSEQFQEHKSEKDVSVVLKEDNDSNGEIFSNEKQNDECYIEEEEVRTKIKEHILNKTLLKILLYLHRTTPNYTSLQKTDREEFVKDIILGKTELLTQIEKQIDIELNSMDLSEMNEKDIEIVKDMINNVSDIQKEEMERLKQEEHKIDERISLIMLNEQQQDTKVNELLISLQNEQQQQQQQLNEDNTNQSIVKKYRQAKEITKLLEKEKRKQQRIKYLSSPKFLQIKRLLTQRNLFTKYLKTSYILRYIFEDIIHFICSNSHYVCYIVMILAHIRSSSILSIVYPLGIFCYGLYENPRPGKRFWTLNIKYTIVVLLLKFLLNLPGLDKIKWFKEFMKSADNWKVGIGYYSDTFKADYFAYIFFDTIVLFFLFIQEYVLIAMGLWNQTEKEIENISQAYKRIFENKSKHIDNVKEFNEKFILEKSNESMKKMGFNIFDTKSFIVDNKEQNEIVNENDNKENNNDNNENDINNKENDKKDKKRKDKVGYFESLFPRIRNEKPGATYYPLFTTILMLIIVYLILFYSKMDQDKTYDSMSTNVTKISGTMVIWVFLFVTFAVIDRIVYVRQSRSNLRFRYKFYDINTGKQISPKAKRALMQSIYTACPELQHKKHFEIPLSHIAQLEDKYNIVIIQKETPNFPLITKYIMNIAITIIVHGMVFFFLPMYGNLKLNNSVYCTDNSDQCNDFLNNKWIILFYLINLLYLFTSSLQIKHGYLDVTPKSLIKSDYTAIHEKIHMLYKLVPFLYELKLAIDWTFTPTSLDIFQWNTFESVYDLFYSTLCSNIEPNEDPVGTPIPKSKKSYLGAPIFIGIIVLLIGPLLLFSNLNPINEVNNVISASIELQLSIQENSLYKNYTLFKNNRVDSLQTISDKIWNEYKYNEVEQTQSFPREQVQVIRMSDTSDNNWNLAVPHINHIIEALQNYTENIDQISLKFYYEFTRPIPENNKESLKDIDYILYDKLNKDLTMHEQIANLTNSILYCTHDPIKLPGFYYPMLRLSSIPHPTVLRDDKFPLIDVELSFTCNASLNDGQPDYFRSYFQLRKTNFTDDNHTSFEFHTFSDKISDVTSGYSFVTFYITFVLLAGSYVRDFFAGGPEEIMLSELPDPSKLVSLCEGIKISRHSFDLEKEEQLYYVLIEFIRSPECLRMLTKSLVKQFKERKNKIRNDEDEN